MDAGTQLPTEKDEMNDGNSPESHRNAQNIDHMSVNALAEHIIEAAPEVAPNLTCAEAEHLASFLRTIISEVKAQEFLMLHAKADDDPFDDHAHLYQLQIDYPSTTQQLRT